MAGMTDATAFDLIPAIDLRAGRVVRLRQGDFARETVYDDEPAVVAARFADGGARSLHVVDLDGARGGEPVNAVAVRAIVDGVGDRMHVEVAGGLRSEGAVASALANGAIRAVIGTAALEVPGFAAHLVESHGADRIAVAIDVRDGQAVGHGWTAGSPGVDAVDAIRRLANVGVATFEVTAIDRDGLLGGPDLALYRRVVALGLGSIVASGGIATIEDLLALRLLGCRGAIVGRALLDGSMDLREAMAALAT